jgi:hypothetical protein
MGLMGPDEALLSGMDPNATAPMPDSQRKRIKQKGASYGMV